MKKTIIVVATTVLAAILFSVACAEKSPAEQPSAEKSSDEKPVAEVSVAELSSKEAYETVLLEIRELQQSPSARSNMEKTIEKIENKLKGFIEGYPETPEAHDAKYQLGVLYSNTQNPKEAIKYLKEFLSSNVEADLNDENKVVFGHYSLAESYKNNGEYESAKNHYQIIIDRYPSVNTRILAMARSNLDDMDVIRKLAIGKEPIPFEVTDIKGNPLSLEKYKGKVVLLDFWATWCMPCLQEMPNVKRVYKQYQKEGFEIIGISLDRQRSALDSYIRKNDIKWPQYYDGKYWNNDIAMKYRIRSIPATFLLDRKGKIRYKSLRGSELARAVEKLIKEKN